MRIWHALPLVLLGVSPVSVSVAQNADSLAVESYSLFEYFQNGTDTLPRVVLDTDWGMLLRTKMQEQYQDATFGFSQSDGKFVELKVRIRTRGNIRKEVCRYPPLKVKFQKKDLRDLGFNSMNEVKLVLPCGNGPREADYLLREALIYKLWELVHPVFIRSRVVGLTGVNGEKERFSSYGLLLEHEEEIAPRLKAQLVERGVLYAPGLERDCYLKMVFFQYMIANTDWSVPNRHNLLVVEVPGYRRVLAIPYDFDYSGFVGAPYAVPAEAFPIKDVRDRYFLGYGVSEEEAKSTARFFLEKKEALLDRVANYELLEENSRRQLRDMLEEFFDELANEKAMLRTFMTKK